MGLARAARVAHPVAQLQVPRCLQIKMTAILSHSYLVGDPMTNPMMAAATGPITDPTTNSMMSSTSRASYLPSVPLSRIFLNFDT